MMIKIFHNPKCSTSRETLRILYACGKNPEIIEYLKTPLTKKELIDLVKKTGRPINYLLREKEPICDELGLKEKNINDDLMLEAIVNHPILLNRPIVATKDKAIICRPADLVKTLFTDPT